MTCNTGTDSHVTSRKNAAFYKLHAATRLPYESHTFVRVRHTIRLHTTWMGIPASVYAAHMRLVLLLMQVLLYRQQQMSDILQYRWFSWGVASLPEGKSQCLCLVQLCPKYRLVSTT